MSSLEIVSFCSLSLSWVELNTAFIHHSQVGWLTMNISSSLAFLLASLLCFITLKAMIVHQTRITRKGSLSQTVGKYCKFVLLARSYLYIHHTSQVRAASNITKNTRLSHYQLDLFQYKMNPK